MSDEFGKAKHTVYMENREKLELGGITDVEEFNGEEISASSEWGDITVKGSGLHVDTLDVESGVLKISGKIGAVVYTEPVIRKGWIKKVFS